MQSALPNPQRCVVEFSWKIFAAALIGNSVWMLLMMLPQFVCTMPARHSVILGTRRQQFLYFQDFWVHIPGDTLFVPFVINTFLHLALASELTPKDCVSFAGLTLFCGMLLFVVMTKPDHKPDFNNTDSGGLNFGGWAHVAYFGVCWAMAIVCLGHIAEGTLRGPVMWTGLTGGLLYLCCPLLDSLAGKFQPLTKI